LGSVCRPKSGCLLWASMRWTRSSSNRRRVRRDRDSIGALNISNMAQSPKTDQDSTRIGRASGPHSECAWAKAQERQVTGFEHGDLVALTGPRFDDLLDLPPAGLGDHAERREVDLVNRVCRVAVEFGNPNHLGAAERDLAVHRGDVRTKVVVARIGNVGELLANGQSSVERLGR